MRTAAIKTYKFNDNAFTSFAYNQNENAFYAITDRWLIIRISCDDFDAKYIFADSGQKYLEGFVARKSWCDGNNVFFVSFTGEKYIVYNIKSNTIREEYIGIKDSISNIKTDNVLDLIDYGNYLYLFIKSDSSIVKIEKNTWKIKEVIKADFSFNKSKFIFYNKEEYLIFDKYVKVFSFSDEEFRDAGIKIEFENLLCMYVYQEYIYMLSSSGEIAKCDLLGNIEHYNIGGKENDFSIIVKAGDKLWVFPSLGDNIYYLQDGVIKLFEEYDEEFSYYAEKDWFLIGSKFFNYVETENNIFFPARVSNRIIALDKTTGNLSFHKITFSDKKPLIKNILIEKNIVKEGDYDITINDYLSFIH